jgi:hypothetical protein
MCLVAGELRKGSVSKMRFDETTVVPRIAKLSADGGGALEELQSILEVGVAALRSGVLERLHDEIFACAAAVTLRAGVRQRSGKRCCREECCREQLQGWSKGVPALHGNL